MASDDLIEIEGKIKEVFPGGHFLVETEAGTQEGERERAREGELKGEEVKEPETAEEDRVKDQEEEPSPASRTQPSRNREPRDLHQLSLSSATRADLH